MPQKRHSGTSPDEEDEEDEEDDDGFQGFFLPNAEVNDALLLQNRHRVLRAAERLVEVRRHRLRSKSGEHRIPKMMREAVDQVGSRVQPLSIFGVCISVDLA